MSAKLVALDVDDLAVVSANVQDAIVAPRDILWRQSERRLIIGMRRPDWDSVRAGELPEARRLAALRFDRVLACKSRGIDMSADTSLELIGIEFNESDPPGGAVILLFFPMGALRLDVECLECELADFGEDDLMAEPVPPESAATMRDKG